MSDFSTIEQELAKIAGAVDEELLALIAEEAINIIEARTTEGRGPDGRIFQPYSDAWAKVRRRAGLQTGRVDLAFDLDGGMRRQIVYETDEGAGQATIGFRTREKAEIARRHMLGRGVPKRAFFTLNEAEVGQVTEAAGQQIFFKLKI